MIMSTYINGIKYYIHPIYDLYGADEDGNVIHLITRIPHKGNITNSGYLAISVRKWGWPGQKRYKVHRFIYECFNNMIPAGMAITHINKDKLVNRICTGGAGDCL